MNITEVYKNNSFLKTEDLEGQSVSLEIGNVSAEEVGDKNKLVLSFVNFDKVFVCNVTNARIIADVLGSPETDTWVGKTITLRPDKTTFQGRLTDCIRVDAMKQQQAA